MQRHLVLILFYSQSWSSKLHALFHDKTLKQEGTYKELRLSTISNFTFSTSQLSEPLIFKTFHRHSSIVQATFIPYELLQKTGLNLSHPLLIPALYIVAIVLFWFSSGKNHHTYHPTHKTTARSNKCSLTSFSLATGQKLPSNCMPQSKAEGTGMSKSDGLPSNQLLP